MLAVLVVSMIAVVMPGSALAQTTFTADDVVVTGNAGVLQSLTIAPDGEVNYDGLEAEPTEVVVTVSAKQSSSNTWEDVGNVSVAASGLEGSVNYSFSEIDLLAKTSMKRSDFKAGDGTTEETDVDVRVTATLVDAGPNGSNVTTSSSTVLTVSVTNEPAGGNIGGRVNGGGSAA